MSVNTRTHTDLYMVFDVESCGPHGTGFAAGWVVVDADGKMLADGIAVATVAVPTINVSEWVRDNVLPNLPPSTHASLQALRDEFWGVWWDWRRKGARLAADVAWPVEARFLAACVDDHPIEREWDGPYPLLDIASIRLAAGFDPLAEVERLPIELPAHNPLADARQSARLLLEALATLRNELAPTPWRPA